MKCHIHKHKLLSALQANRDEHRKVFEEALAGYKREMIEHLNRMIEDIRAGKRVHHTIAILPPSDHTEDYDRAIGMVTATSQDTIELTAEEYGNLVMDRWAWMDHFLTQNARYSKTAADKLQQ